MGVAGWLQTKVTKQWDYYLTDLEGNKEEVVDSLENKATYVLEKSGRIIATLTLEAKPSEWDVEIWGDKPREDVTYLHRLAVHRGWTPGLGRAEG